MRVLVMASRDPQNPFLGGGEIVLSEFARALARTGHHVSYLCSTFPSSPKETWIEGIHVRRLASETILGPAAFLTYEKEYKGRVGLVLEDILGGSTIPFFAPLYVREPIVSVWFQDHLPIFKTQYPVLLLPVLAGLERLLVLTHRRTHILVPSAASKASLIRKGADPNRILIFHPGISPGLLGEGIPPADLREPRIICLGKIRRYKCIHHAILALSAVLKQIPEARLSIVGRMGDKKYFHQLIALAEELGLRERIDIEVGVSEGRKKELLRTSRVLISPAPVEGFGIAIVEASACGLPVVGTYGVPDDSLIEEVNGFRVPFGDIEAIAERILRLLTDDGLFNRISKQAHEFARQFTWETAVEPLLDLVADFESPVH